MMKIWKLLVVSFLVFSCDTSGVKTSEKETSRKNNKQTVVNTLDKEHKVIASKKLEKTFDGVTINWFEKGKGDKIVAGDLVAIDFKLKLKDGTVVDGNHFLKKDFFPFLVGYRMQTDLWDYALQQMSIGDFVEIKIPAKLARGDKGLGTHIPANADNYLVLRAIKKITPNRVVDGTKVWLIEADEQEKVKFNEGKTVVFHTMASSTSGGMFANTFRSNTPFEFTLGDQGIVPGLRKALINAKTSDRMYVLVTPEDAYGNKGYMDFVKPGESVFYNLMVLDVLEK
ncbi:MAG: FKBP-type peptidyl-prolyl cis-trans isomerase [Bacteroidota bacterium]